MVTKKSRITLYLPDELKERLTELAEKDKRSLSVFIEVLVLEALETRDKPKS